MISNFEKALNRVEFPDYFRVSGIYFTRGPDWGNQLHIINWQGLCGFLETQKDPVQILKGAFEKYVITVKNSLEDANDLLENIGCYYYMRKKDLALSANGYDLILDMSSNEKRTISKCMEFLHQERNKTTNAQDIELYSWRLSKLINDGGPSDIANL
ncbi:hypothetical protein [Pseudomonas sp. BGI-2]|uniref:hypothetical protein n=1 Tax=Pseudomonas sp. BGI-2 TaxID=2528211 RepID=UPI001034672C|nr:hypothetical protein [Pseudomonas sp. BGI-2]TBN36343.1 hypothetical protein EYC95_24740 [Pseudomonas sp. BGI-2]